MHEIEELIRRHGLRGLLNMVATVVEAAAARRDSLPYDTGSPDADNNDIDPDDLRVAAGNLRADLY
jgi:hypothetical protein